MKELLDKYGLETLAHYMDSELREDVHHSFTGDTDLEFLVEYMAAHLEKHGEAFDKSYL